MRKEKPVGGGIGRTSNVSSLGLDRARRNAAALNETKNTSEKKSKSRSEKEGTIGMAGATRRD